MRATVVIVAMPAVHKVHLLTSKIYSRLSVTSVSVIFYSFAVAFSRFLDMDDNDILTCRTITDLVDVCTWTRRP